MSKIPAESWWHWFCRTWCGLLPMRGCKGAADWGHLRRHRWTRWTVKFDECPDGEVGTFEFRSRRCRRKGCDMVEEVCQCVSSSPEVARGLTP